MFEKLFQMKLKRIERRGERQKAKYELEEQYAEYYPHKNGTKVSNVMLAIVVISIMVYTIASFWLTYATGESIDSTLTTCFYAFWCSEVFCLMGIKISKVRKENYSEDMCEDTYEEEEV